MQLQEFLTDNERVVSKARVFYHRHMQSIMNNHQQWPLWCGRRIIKYPSDIVAYQMILWETRPEILIETGTEHGGSCHFFATMFDIIGRGEVITIDIDNQRRHDELANHPRITYFSGSSVDPNILEQAEMRIGKKTCMVVLDSDHTCSHVRKELENYHAFVTPGQYLVVEDTTINGHPVLPRWGAGPTEALEKFLPDHPEFEPVAWEDRILFSQNIGGWLRKKG